MRSLGRVEAIAASGKSWVGNDAVDMSEMLFRELRAAKRSIQISSFSMGHKSNKTDELFEILELKMKNPLMKMSVIINDDKNDKTVTPYARKQIEKIRKKFPDRFFPQYFKQKKLGNLNKILHAKIIVIDGRSALIGSANLSKGALESNYEIMVKISGEAAVKMSRMLSHLAEQIRGDMA